MTENKPASLGFLRPHRLPARWRYVLTLLTSTPINCPLGMGSRNVTPCRRGNEAPSKMNHWPWSGCVCDLVWAWFIFFVYILCWFGTFFPLVFCQPFRVLSTFPSWPCNIMLPVPDSLRSWWNSWAGELAGDAHEGFRERRSHEWNSRLPHFVWFCLPPTFITFSTRLFTNPLTASPLAFTRLLYQNKSTRARNPASYAG